MFTGSKKERIKKRRRNTTKRNNNQKSLWWQLGRRIHARIHWFTNCSWVETQLNSADKCQLEPAAPLTICCQPVKFSRSKASVCGACCVRALKTRLAEKKTEKEVWKVLGLGEKGNLEHGSLRLVHCWKWNKEKSSNESFTVQLADRLTTRGSRADRTVSVMEAMPRSEAPLRAQTNVRALHLFQVDSMFLIRGNFLFFVFFSLCLSSEVAWV